MASVGAETCGGAEPFRLLICFQSDLPPPSPPTLLFLLPPLLFFLNHLLLSHSPRSLVSWAICRTRWAGLTLSSSCRPSREEVRQSFICCSIFHGLRSSDSLHFASFTASGFPAVGRKRCHLYPNELGEKKHVPLKVLSHSWRDIVQTKYEIFTVKNILKSLALV